MSVVGVDLGEGRLAAVVLDDRQAVLYRIWLAYRPASYPDALHAIAAAVDQCRQAAVRTGAGITRVGVAVAGPLSRDRSRVLAAPHLGFADQPMGQDLRHRLGVPVTLENDTNAAAIAEHRRGAGAGARSLLLLSLGTGAGNGIGGGLVIDGQVLAGASGAGGELGHLPVEPDGRSCGCGARGCLEQYASPAAILDRAAAAIATGTAPLLAELAGTGGRRVTSRHVVTAAAAGDPVATGLLVEAGERIGRALSMLAPAVDPDVVLLSGWLAHAAAGQLLPPIRSTLVRTWPFRQHRTAAPVRLAACGPDAGALGAAELARTADQAPVTGAAPVPAAAAGTLPVDAGPHGGAVLP